MTIPSNQCRSTSHHHTLQSMEAMLSRSTTPLRHGIVDTTSRIPGVRFLDDDTIVCIERNQNEEGNRSRKVVKLSKLNELIDQVLAISSEFNDTLLKLDNGALRASYNTTSIDEDCN